MNFDLRLPLGLMFSIFGIILVSHGYFGDQRVYAKSLNMNVNLGWGTALLAFGVLMLVLSFPKKPRAQ